MVFIFHRGDQRKIYKECRRIPGAGTEVGGGIPIPISYLTYIYLRTCPVPTPIPTSIMHWMGRMGGLDPPCQQTIIGPIKGVARGRAGIAPNYQGTGFVTYHN